MNEMDTDTGVYAGAWDDDAKRWHRQATHAFALETTGEGLDGW